MGFVKGRVENSQDREGKAIFYYFRFLSDLGLFEEARDRLTDPEVRKLLGLENDANWLANTRSALKRASFSQAQRDLLCAALERHLKPEEADHAQFIARVADAYMSQPDVVNFFRDLYRRQREQE